MDGAWLAAGHFATAALMLALSAIVFWVDPASAVGRAFVAFLILRAASVISIPLAELAGDPATSVALASTNLYLHIALAGSIACLISLYPNRSRGWVRVGIVAVVIATELVVALRPCWILCNGAEGGVLRGPLFLLVQSYPLAVSIAAAAFFAASRSMSEGPRRTSTRLLGGAFAVESALAAGLSLSVLTRGGSPIPLFSAFFASTVLAIILTGRIRLTAIVVVIMAFASGFVGNLIGGRATLVDPGLLLIGAWRLLLPALAAYALLRHRLFDLDVRVRLGAQRAMLGAVFAGVFFVVTEGGAYMLGSKFGMLAGIVAVGALVPAMGPLRRAAERLTEMLPGEAAPARDLPIERRRQIYHEFAVQAWADGVLAREERAFLDSVRARLGLSADDALSLESEASRTTKGG